MIVPPLVSAWLRTAAIFCQPSIRRNLILPACHEAEQQDDRRVGHCALLDHLVGAQQQRRRDRQAEGLGGLEVDHEFIFGRQLHRELVGTGATQDAVDVRRRPRTDSS